MHMIKSFAFLIATLDVAFTQILSNPDAVPKATRDQWCLSQRTECPYICTQLPGTDGSPVVESNTCSADTLSYSCICSNGQAPNATQYSQTIPYFICTENNNECVAACGNSQCQSDCRQNNPCGAQDPKRVNTSTISTMSATGTGAAASASGTGGTVFTGFGGSGGAAATTGASSGNQKGGASQTMLHIGQFYGVAVVVVGFFAGFAIVL